MSRIYVASSWRNQYQPAVVETLRANGHQVYDFRNPPSGTGFAWHQVAPEGKIETFDDYMDALKHPVACAGYLSDYRAMEWADTCVLALPSGRSAHLEAGWFAGRGKRLLIFTHDREEPELMALMANGIHNSMSGILRDLKS